MEKLDKNTLSIYFAILILIGIFCFYWYSYRPEHIRKSCINTFADFPKDSAEEYSRNCILQNGLTP